jgi:hypothetical protein
MIASMAGRFLLGVPDLGVLKVDLLGVVDLGVLKIDLLGVVDVDMMVFAERANLRVTHGQHFHLQKNEVWRVS